MSRCAGSREEPCCYSSWQASSASLFSSQDGARCGHGMELASRCQITRSLKDSSVSANRRRPVPLVGDIAIAGLSEREGTQFVTSICVKPTRGVPYRGPRSVTIPRCCALGADACVAVCGSSPRPRRRARAGARDTDRAVDRGHAGRPGAASRRALVSRSFSTAQSWPTAAGSPISVCSGRGRVRPDVTRALDAARGVLWELETAA